MFTLLMSNDGVVRCERYMEFMPTEERLDLHADLVDLCLAAPADNVGISLRIYRN